MKRPLPLDPTHFADQTAHLTARELGAMTRIALHFWRAGSLPQQTADLAVIARVGPDAMEIIGERVMPFFAPGGLFPILREAALAKFERRSKAGRLNRAKGGGRKPSNERAHQNA